VDKVGIHRELLNRVRKSFQIKMRNPWIAKDIIKYDIKETFQDVEMTINENGISRSFWSWKWEMVN